MGLQSRTVFCGTIDDNNCTLSADGSGDNATEVDTGEEEECEYYDDWWIFGADGSGSGEEEEEEETKKRRRRQAEGSGEEGSGDEAEADDSASEAGGEGGNGTVASGDGGNSTKKEIDLSIFSKRCKPEPVEPCGNTTFGCCPDEFHAAEGPFKEGCLE